MERRILCKAMEVYIKGTDRTRENVISDSLVLWQCTQNAIGGQSMTDCSMVICPMGNEEPLSSFLFWKQEVARAAALLAL